MRELLAKIFKQSDEVEDILIHSTDFTEYSQALIHAWLRTLFILGATLIPIFFLLDMVTIPDESRHLLPRFGIYRAVSTGIVILQFIIIIRTSPSKYSFLHGYVFSFIVSLAIVLMTMDLGGFDSSYYAGLNLVIIAVNLLLPWKAFHSALNGTLTILMYLIINFLFGGNFQIKTLIGNLYFMSSTVIIAASINHVKYVLIQKDFANRMSLKQARDALWSEMEVAKRIQTALVPPNTTVGHYEIAAVMIPAAEVGGDYYDIIPTTADPWVMIGDVSGHGVESGLIMMMTQTSVRTILARTPQVEPSKLLIHLNKVIKENISKLNVDRYLTITAINLKENEITYAGSHQDLLVYRKAEHKIESIPSYGTWVGMLDDVDEYMKDRTLPIYKGDMVLLFTDGVTEIGFEQKNMYGQERLERCFLENINLPLKEIIDRIVQDALNFCPNQEDDITIVIVRRI